jgi:MFS transporter, FSR family, fosmidomycin resistance protein
MPGRPDQPGRPESRPDPGRPAGTRAPAGGGGGRAVAHPGGALAHRTRTLWLLILGHGAVDLAAGALFALLPFLVDERDYTLAAVGTFALVANVTNGACQPLFGLHGDRREARWALPLGLVLAGAGIGVAGMTTQFPATLAAVVVCMAGVAAYHPEGARLARGTAMGRVEARMGLFSVGGGIGYMLGPLVVAVVLAALGLGGTVLVGAVPLVAAAGVALGLRRVRPGAAAEARPAATAAGAPSEWRAFGLLFAMFSLSSSVATGLLVYLPVYVVETGTARPSAGSVMTSVLMGAGAVGMVLGGFIAQRFSRRLVLVAPALVLVPAILLMPGLGYAAMLPLAALAGLAMEANYSLAIVIGQEYLPSRMGLSTGLLNGFSTAVAGLVLFGLGLLGDVAGPMWMLYALGLLPLGVMALALVLPRPAACPAETRWNLRRGLRVER